MSKDQSVQVAVRVRPLVPSEKNRGCESIVRKTLNQPQVVVGSGPKNNDIFTFNHVFAPEDTQEMLYENAVKSMVMNLFKGYNVTILAYGQTGSGKTHTMGTAYDGSQSEDIGVIPRAVTEIFQQIEEMSDFTFNVNCAFIELYQEKLYDLLSTNQREQSIVDIREIDSKIVIPNLTEVVVGTAKETTDCLIRASSERKVGSTAMNAQSSRSHAIFTITVQKIKKDDANSATCAKFHLVDLAGSERSKKTLAVGEQFKEGVKINQGLLALGNVISALGSQGNGKGQVAAHIGYRDSKLTRLLQDSLGGNSMTLMIACVSPADYNMEESLSTLRYADRARKIKNKPIVNEDPKMAEINRLKAELQSLRVEMLSRSGTTSLALVQKCEECERPPSKHELQIRVCMMTEKLQLTLTDIANRENIISEYEDTIDELNKKVTDLKDQMVALNELISDDMSPEDMKKYQESIHEINANILQLDNRVHERKETILESSKLSETVVIDATMANQDEEFVGNNKMYIDKQVNYQEELKDIRAQIAMKEALHKKLFSNYEQICSIEADGNSEPQIKDYEKIIAGLEKEREELKETLRSKNTVVSAKLAEERRKRVQHLEQEINEVKKKNKQQAMMLKQREKDSEKISKLNMEIQDMKALKVKLIRKMKSESEEFRQWRQIREKEVVQLKAKDRKMQTEAAKKDQLHEKQRNVLKRKVEEANSANKRLREALDRQKQNKQKKTSAQSTASWIDEELEVIRSIVDIKHSFDQLVEIRAELKQQLFALKKEKPPNRDQIDMLQKDIEMRSAQIADLGGKISSNDIDAKMKGILENLNSLPESRSAVKQLLGAVVEMRTNSNTYFAQARDARSTIESYEEKRIQMEADFKQKIDELVEEKNINEADNVEKMAILLKALSSKGSYSDDEKKAMELMEEELSRKNEEIDFLRSQLNTTRIRKKPRYIELKEDLNNSELNDSIVTQPDDPEDDPDYMPEVKRISKRSFRTSASNSVDEPLEKISKNTSKKQKCGCKAGCKAMCGCKKSELGCNETCHCKGNCQNSFNSMVVEQDSADESEPKVLARNSDDEEKENPSEFRTPKKLRLEYEDDALPYIYSAKKRNPFFQNN